MPSPWAILPAMVKELESEYTNQLLALDIALDKITPDRRRQLELLLLQVTARIATGYKSDTDICIFMTDWQREMMDARRECQPPKRDNSTS